MIPAIASAASDAISLRTVNYRVDVPRVKGGSVALDRESMRGRFAVRLGAGRSDEQDEVRVDHVRHAFNSPLWPFVLATTSIGPPEGRIALGAVTLVVALLATLQLIGLRRIGTRPVTGTAPVTLRVERLIAASPDEVWATVANAGDYARFAAGIATSHVVPGEGGGMTRICTDSHGGSWTEGAADIG